MSGTNIDQGRENSPGLVYPQSSNPVEDDYFPMTGIAAQAYRLSKLPKQPLLYVAVRDANKNYSKLAPNLFYVKGRFLYIIAAATGPAPATMTPTSGTGSGTFASSTSTTGTKTAAGWTADDLIGSWVICTGGTGAGQVRKIIDNSATVITVDKPWAVALSTDTTFVIVNECNLHVMYEEAEADARREDYTWTGTNSTLTLAAPDTDTAMDVEGLETVAITLRPGSVAAGAATFTLTILGSVDGGLNYDTTTLPLVTSHVTQAKSTNQTKPVNVKGLTHIKFRLTTATAAMVTTEFCYATASGIK